MAATFKSEKQFTEWLAANPAAPLPPSAFDRALAWFFVVLTGVGALGAWGCLCAVLALEYVR